MLTFKQFLLEEKDRLKLKVHSLPDHVNDWMYNKADEHGGFTNIPHTTKQIPMNRIKTGQSSVDKETIHYHVKSKLSAGPIHVVHYKGNYHVTDGHHRYVAARALKKKHITAHVIDASEVESLG